MQETLESRLLTPQTNVGSSVTISNEGLFSSTNFQAACSASVLDAAYLRNGGVALPNFFVASTAGKFQSS
jgi:hypothetical protein